MLMRDKGGRKKQARSNKQQSKQHSTPKAVTFPKKNEQPCVELEPTTLHTLDRVLYQLSYRCSPADTYLFPAVVEELYLDVPTERDWLGQHQVNNGVRFSEVLVHFGGVNASLVQPHHK